MGRRRHDDQRAEWRRLRPGEAGVWMIRPVTGGRLQWRGVPADHSIRQQERRHLYTHTAYGPFIPPYSGYICLFFYFIISYYTIGRLCISAARIYYYYYYCYYYLGFVKCSKTHTFYHQVSVINCPPPKR